MARPLPETDDAIGFRRACRQSRSAGVAKPPAFCAESQSRCWQGGGPSHVDLFDPKPVLTKMAKQDIPDSIRPANAFGNILSSHLLHDWLGIEQIGVRRATALPQTNDAIGLSREMRAGPGNAG